jgi:hypothetical protein
MPNHCQSTLSTTQLLIIPWHISQSRHTWMAKRTSTCDPHIERETLHVYLNVPPREQVEWKWRRQKQKRLLSAWVRVNKVDCGCAAKFSDQVQTGIASEEQHQTVVWKMAVWGCPCTVKRPGRTGPSEEKGERAREAFQRSPRNTTNRASGQPVSYNLPCDAFFTRVCGWSHTAIPLTTQVNRFYEVCQGIMNNSVFEQDCSSAIHNIIYPFAQCENQYLIIRATTLPLLLTTTFHFGKIQTLRNSAAPLTSYRI